MTDDEIEQALQAKGLNAPRLTFEDIQAAVVAEQFYVFPGATLTVCCLTLRNGYNVVGESAAVSPENFDAEIGREVARNNAWEQIWKLEGYLLKQRVFEGQVRGAS